MRLYIKDHNTIQITCNCLYKQLIQGMHQVYQHMNFYFYFFYKWT